MGGEGRVLCSKGICRNFALPQSVPSHVMPYMMCAGVEGAARVSVELRLTSTKFPGKLANMSRKEKEGRRIWSLPTHRASP